MYDAALYYQAKSEKTSTVLNRFRLDGQPYVLATIHRVEDTDDLVRLNAIVRGLGAVAEQSVVVWPLHLRTRCILAKHGMLRHVSEKIMVIEPVGYLDMIQLERHASVIVTDSGGVQKEAYFYRVPCVTLRTETEWVELVETGWTFSSPRSPSGDL